MVSIVAVAIIIITFVLAGALAGAWYLCTQRSRRRNAKQLAPSAEFGTREARENFLTSARSDRIARHDTQKINRLSSNVPRHQRWNYDNRIMGSKDSQMGIASQLGQMSVTVPPPVYNNSGPRLHMDRSYPPYQPPARVKPLPMPPRPTRPQTLNLVGTPYVA
jgi:hypothetical protein